MIRIKLDPTEVISACKDSYEEVKKVLSGSVNKLAKAAETHLIQLVTAELNPYQKDMFLGGKEKNNIELTSLDPNVHILTIKDRAVLIDDGKPMDMKTDDWLMKGPITPAGEPGVHMGKKGKYRVIPFEHGGTGGKSQSDTAKFQRQLTGRIKEEIEIQNKLRKARGHNKISFGGLERYKIDYKDPKTGEMHKKGEIVEGKLHTFDVFGNKKKSIWSHMPLEGLSVYQKIQRDQNGSPILDKKGKVKATRSWMTFRTASQGVPEKFWYPAPETKNFLERTGEWAEQEFYNKIVPGIIANWKD